VGGTVRKTKVERMEVVMERTCSQLVKRGKAEWQKNWERGPTTLGERMKERGEKKSPGRGSLKKGKRVESKSGRGLREKEGANQPAFRMEKSGITQRGGDSS